VSIPKKRSPEAFVISNFAKKAESKHFRTDSEAPMRRSSQYIQNKDCIMLFIKTTVKRGRHEAKTQDEHVDHNEPEVCALFAIV
jgi:hypothetical protein